MLTSHLAEQRSLLLFVSLFDALVVSVLFFRLIILEQSQFTVSPVSVSADNRCGNMAVPTEGTFRDLFDPDRTRFVQAAQPFADLESAREAFAQIWTDAKQARMNRQLQSRLTARLQLDNTFFAQVDQRRVCREVFSFLDSPAITVFCHRFLLTNVNWATVAPLTYGDLLVHGFVQMHYIGTAFDSRAQLEGVYKALSKSSQWTRTKNAFIHGYSAFLPVTLINGPNLPMGHYLTLTVDGIENDGCPLFAFLAYPLLAMAQGFFRGSFNYNPIRSHNINTFIKTNKSKTGTGVYSESHLRDKLGRQHTKIDFLGSLFYPILRVLTLDCEQFSTDNCNPM